MAGEIDSIIIFLNVIAKARFSTQNIHTKKLINKVLKEYTAQEIKEVLKFKYEDWENSSFSNGKPALAYFTPSTLFAFSNFEKYYHAYSIHKKKGQAVEKLMDFLKVDGDESQGDPR